VQKMSNLVQRRVGKEPEIGSDKQATDDELKAKNSADLGSEEEMEPLPSMPSGDETLPQDKANVEVLNSALKDLNPRWKNWVIRGIFTWIMIFIFGFIVYLGTIFIEFSSCFFFTLS